MNPGICTKLKNYWRTYKLVMLMDMIDLYIMMKIYDDTLMTDDDDDIYYIYK